MMGHAPLLVCSAIFCLDRSPYRDRGSGDKKTCGGVRGLVHKNRLRRDEENVKGKLLLSREPGPAVKEHDEGGDHRKDEGPEF